MGNLLFASRVDCVVYAEKSTNRLLLLLMFSFCTVFNITNVVL